MPTGYTAKIAEGISFRQYAMGCARAFGVCIEMRDEPSDVPIHEQFEPSNYHKDALKAAQDRIAELQAMTDAECDVKAAKELVEQRAEIAKSIQKSNKLRAKYETMLKCATAFNPPTKDHVEFKKFMCSQIEESIKFDCGTEFAEQEQKRLAAKNGKQWRHEQMAAAHDSIAYHSKHYEEDIARAKDRTDWVNQLRKALK